MRNIKMTVAYDGTLYHGFQKQRGTGLSTIQESLEYALSVLTQEEIVINGSGRTDAGVHALGQVINFQTNSKIAPERFPLAVNSLLPKDIRVLECENVAVSYTHLDVYKRQQYRQDQFPMTDSKCLFTMHTLRMCYNEALIESKA